MALTPDKSEIVSAQLESQLQDAWNAYAAMRSLEVAVPELRGNSAYQVLIGDAFFQFHEAFEATL